MGDSKPATLRRELHITYSIWFKGKMGLFAWSLFWMKRVAPIAFLGWFDRTGSVCLFARLGGIGLCRSATRAPKPSVDCGCIRSRPQPVLGLGVLLSGMLRNHGTKRKTHRDSLDEVAVHFPVHRAAKGFSHVRFPPWFGGVVLPLWPGSDL